MHRDHPGSRDGPTPPGGGDRAAAAAIAEVLRAAGVDPPPGLRIRVLEGGSRRAAKWVVETPQGPLVVKRRREGAGVLARRWPQLRWRTEVEAHLHHRGIPVAEPPVARLVVVDDAAYELSAFVEGDRCGRQPGPVAAAGAMLAGIHAVLGELEAPPRLRGSWHDASSVREALAGLRSEDAAVELAQRYDAAAAACREAVAASPQQLLHGDYHPGNLVMAQGRVAAVLDWEAIRSDAVLLEVAASLLGFCVRIDAACRAWPDLACVAAFAGAYRDAGGVPLDAEAFAMAMIEATIAAAALRARRRGGGEDAGASLGEAARTCEAILRSAAAIAIAAGGRS